VVGLDQALGLGQALPGIAAQQAGVGPALQHVHQLPAQVEGVLHRHVHALPGLGLWVWQASPAVNTRGARGDLVFGHVVELVGQLWPIS
jgi:hypothetical protein